MAYRGPRIFSEPVAPNSSDGAPQDFETGDKHIERDLFVGRRLVVALGGPLIDPTHPSFAGGMLGDGVTPDDPALQAAELKAAAVNGTVLIPPPPKGVNYLITKTVLVDDNVTIAGVGWLASVLKGSATLPASTTAPFTGLNVSMILTNRNYTGGNVNIVIRDLTLDDTAHNLGSDHCIHLRNTTSCRLLNVRTSGGGDGVAFTLSSRFFVGWCESVNPLNAGFDCWETSSRGTFFACDVVNHAGLAGFLATGLSTLNQSATTSEIKIIGGSVFGGDQGIWLQGGVVGAQIGVIQDCEVFGVMVDTINTFHGLRISDGTRNEVHGCHFTNIWVTAIELLGEVGGSGPTDCNIHDNVISNTNVSGGGDAPGIDLSPGTTGCDIHDNRLLGGAHVYTYGILARATTDNNLIHDNRVAAGSVGTILAIGGNNNRAYSNPGFNPTGNNVIAPAFPATTVTITNANNRASDVVAYIVNGAGALTVQVDSVVCGIIPANGFGTVRIPAGSTFRPTYGAGAPTWAWYGE